MAVTFRQNPDGTLRPYWYGVYNQNGKRKVVNLDVLIKGNPPQSKSLKEAGDKDFEDSRDKAEEALSKFQAEAGKKGRTEHLIERLIESKSGQETKYTLLADLPSKWLAMVSPRQPNPRYIKVCLATLNRFLWHCRASNPKIKYCYEVTKDIAQAFLSLDAQRLAKRTLAGNHTLLRVAFAEALPVGVINPFSGKIAKKGKDSDGEHRVPFSALEIAKLFDRAKTDSFLGGLVVCGACTGMRRGDICNLKWQDVDLQKQIIKIKTSKTKTEIEIPILDPLMNIFKQLPKNSIYVFPEAQNLAEKRSDTLTRLFRNFIFMALDGNLRVEKTVDVIPLPQALAEGKEALQALPDSPRKEKILVVLGLYCSGFSYRQIQKNQGIQRSQISQYLGEVVKLIGKEFRKKGVVDSLKRAGKEFCQIDRVNGSRKASVRDWHSLRTTFITLALNSGVPVAKVQKITGSKSVEIVMEHYYQPEAKELQEALEANLPSVLTGK